MPTWIHQMFDIDKDRNVEFNIIEGNFSCHALGKKAFLDSNFACFFFQLPFFLESHGFGFITLSLITPIILITIFGSIKQSYRWFILNQCLWDVLIAYSFICDKPTFNEWFKELYTAQWFQLFRKDSKTWFLSVNQGPPTCFYSSPIYEDSNIDLFKYAINSIFSFTAKNSGYAPLLLLTFSRFACLYFHYFYDKFVTTKRIVFIIIGFNVFCLLLINSNTIYKVIAEPYLAENQFKCFSLCNETDFSNLTQTYNGCLNDCKLIYYKATTMPYFKVLLYSLPPILLIFANIFALLLIAKIVRQFKYQIKHNRTNFLSSLKIASIILFQCFTMTFLFFISLTKNSTTILEEFYITNDIIIEDSWPSWLRFLVLDSTVQCFNLIRIFLDALIILAVLPEYKKAWIGFLHFCVLLFLHPQLAYKKIKSVKNDNQKTIRISSVAPNNRIFTKTLSTVTI